MSLLRPHLPRALGRGLALGAGLGLFVAVSAGAAEEKQKPRTHKVQAASPQVAKALGQVHELLAEKRYAEARKAVQNLLERKGLNAYEEALAWQTSGYIHAAQENYRQAIPAFEKCLALEALSEQSHRNVLYNLGQLYLATEQIDKAIATLEAWFAGAENPSPDAHINLAGAYAQKGEYRKALPLARKAIDLANEPRESWYQLLLGMHYELEEFPQATAVLEEMVRHWPLVGKYWVQLSGLYANVGRERDALAALEVAYRMGDVTEPSDLKRLAQLYLFNGVPYEAARVVERALSEGKLPRDHDNYELLASAWLQAREVDKALPTLRQAAKRAGDGELYVRLGQAYLEKEDYGRAADALRHALAKGGLDDPGNAHLLLGIATFHLDQRNTCRKHLADARQYDSTRRAAEQWLRHLEQRGL